MTELENKIKYYATKYYEGTPEVSDSYFDHLVEQLRDTDPNSELLSKVGWGYEINNPMVEEREHWYDVAKFENKVRNYTEVTIPKDRAVISAKIDGGSICCYYRNGKLEYAITRGDGVKGYDVTDKLKFLVPVDLIDDTFSGLVRGEITMTLNNFNKYYSKDYESVRNLVIGLIKRNTISLDELSRLDFVAYTVRGTTNVDISSKFDVFSWIVLNGFNKVDEFLLDPVDWSDESFRDLIKSYTKYLIDGIVITDNHYIKLEDNTYVPEQEIAYKTKADEAEVTVTDVTWGLTRTGLLYPRVWFTPVKLSGAVISKATAFNAKFVEDNGIGVGAKLVIQRSGEVIPDVVKVINPVKSSLPNECPECHHELVRKGVHLVCDNPDCNGKQLNEVMNWIEVVAGIKGLGHSNLYEFVDIYKAYTVDDLYNVLDKAKNTLKDNFGPATSELLKKMINKLTSPVDFVTFILACNIGMVGWSAASSLSNYKDFILYDELNSKWYDKLSVIKGVNSTGKDNIIKNINKIRRYSKYVKVVDSQVEETTVDKDKIITLTGSLSVTRKKFLEEINKYGWTEGPINKAKYLITNNKSSNSSKAKKARELGVKFLSEDEFRHILTTD